MNVSSCVGATASLQAASQLKRSASWYLGPGASGLVLAVAPHADDSPLRSRRQRDPGAEAEESPGPDRHARVPQDARQCFTAEWDQEGVWVYQAYCEDIADWAVAHQRLGGPGFNPRRMTWFKPSMAWVLYRSGYARKHNQTRVLKIKLSHPSLAALLERCQCKEGGGGSKGRVQWDPARDLFSMEGREPRKLLRGTRAIQIGVKQELSELFVESAVCIQDVTELAHRVHAAHKVGGKEIEQLIPELPNERPYLPECSDEVLIRLMMKEPPDFWDGAKARLKPRKR